MYSSPEGNCFLAKVADGTKAISFVTVALQCSHFCHFQGHSFAVALGFVFDWPRGICRSSAGEAFLIPDLHVGKSFPFQLLLQEGGMPEWEY